MGVVRQFFGRIYKPHAVGMNEEKSRFLITGLNCYILIERHNIYLAIINLMWSIYIYRQQNYKNPRKLTEWQCFIYL